MVALSAIAAFAGYGKCVQHIGIGPDPASAQRLLPDFAQQFPDSPPELQAKARSEAATLSRDSL